MQTKKVEAGQGDYPAPEHLSEHSKALWRSVVPNRARSAARLQVVQTALEALDRARQAGELLNREGLTVKTLATGSIHAHPMIRVEAEATKLFAKLWDSLSLNFDGQIDGRIIDGLRSA